MTARFSVRFVEPVHINVQLTVSADLASERGRRLDLRGGLLDGERLLAEAEGSFVHVPLEHFLRTPEGRAAGEAWRERLDAAPGAP